MLYEQIIKTQSVVKGNTMEELNIDSKRLDKTVLIVACSFDDAEDKTYWLSRTPEERLQHVELLRRINYGDKAAERLQRVLEVAQNS